jgi:hypothetical protein
MFNLSHSRRVILIRAAALSTILVGTFLYLALCAKIEWVEKTSRLMFHANSYRWYLVPDFIGIQRWIVSFSMAAIFILVPVSTRHLNASKPRSRADLALHTGILTAAIWLALCQAFNLATWDWFFVIFAGINAAGLLRLQHAAPFQKAVDKFQATNRTALILTAAATLLAAGFYIIHAGQAIITDAQSQIAQARLILSGDFRLLLSEPLLQAAQIPNFSFTNPTYAQYPPGHILLLLPFIASGIPANVLNILASLATVYITLKLATCVGNRKAAGLGALLLIASPLFLMMGSSAMNHATAMLMLALAAWAFYQVIFFHRTKWLWVGVAALGWAGITRPLTALAHGLVWGPLLTGYGWRMYTLHGRTFQHMGRQVWMHIAAAVLAAIVPVAILITYNLLTTGHALTLGYVASDPEIHRLGFRLKGPYAYTPLHAIHNLFSDVFSLSINMFGMPFNSWIILFGWLMMSRFSRGELVVAALILSQSLLYKLYHFYDLLLGPRFMSELMPYYAILGGIGLARMVELVPPRWRFTALASLAICLVGAFLGGIGYWKESLSTFTLKHVTMKNYIENTVKDNRARVIVVRPDYGETAGDYVFDKKRPIWFVLDKFESTARQAPELRGHEWLRPTFN